MNPATQTRTPSSTKDYLIGSSSFVFKISGLRVRPLPIQAVIWSCGSLACGPCE
jgi:hypothetical protein